MYPIWFLIPSLATFCLFFLIPMVISFFFSLTVWDFKTFTFVGLENFKMFFSERALNIGIRNTMLYAVLTSICKVILAFFLAVFLVGKIRSKNFLRAVLFFPNLVSTIAIGTIFKALMHPTKGLFNVVLDAVGIGGINWLGNTSTALGSVIFTDIWKGLGVATVIYIAGLQTIDKSYYEAAAIDGAGSLQKLKYITLPLVRPTMASVVILSFIGGLRTFDLIWAMTGGGPGFATDVLASIVYKQYAAGFYGLSTAGNVIMLGLIVILVFPLQRALIGRKEEM